MLRAGKFAMVGLGYLAQDLLGQGTRVFDAPCTATSPASMSVLVGSGRIYSMAALEPSAWSSLAADSTPILKQGILASPGATLACPAPITAGLSVNYLVQGQYQELDQSPATLNYWNANNPGAPFSGAGNNGLAQPTIRAGVFVVQVKAGTAATTGTQTTPAADAGWTPMYSVVSANGATTLTAGNISVAAGAAFALPGQQSGSFVVTGVGFTGSVTGTCQWRSNGPLVTLFLPVISGTSNSTGFSYTGLPASLLPSALAFPGATSQTMPLAFAQDNTAFIGDGYAAINSGAAGQIIFARNGASTNWTASGTKAAGGVLSYLIY